MFGVEITYNQYSSYLGHKGDTLESNKAHLMDMLNFYSEYLIKTAVVSEYCDNCTQGKIKKCKAKRLHSNGYHGERCYAICPKCKGEYTHIVYNALGD